MTFQVGTLTAGQFAIYGDIKKALGRCCMSQDSQQMLTAPGATGGVEIAK